MLVLASTLAGALEELPYTFADLPLRDFERKPEASQAAVFLLRRPGQQAGECLAFAGMDALVGAAPCKITDGQLWSYRSQQLVLAHDTSLCLDEFGPHAGNDLGVYWCHGQACLSQPAPLAARAPPLPNGHPSPARARARVTAAAAPFCPRRACAGGANQRFVQRGGTPPSFCSPTVPQAHCIERVAPRDAARPSANGTAVPSPPRPPRPPRPPCESDSAAAVARCAGWAARGECVFNARYMRRHCARTCARAEDGAGRSAECDPDGEGGAGAAPPAMPPVEQEVGWGVGAGGALPKLRTEL